MLDNFVVFILSHGRPNRVSTIGALQRAGYTGDYYIICDNEDEKIDLYKQNFKDQVIVFDKQKEFEKAEKGDNFNNRAVILYARNKCFDIAEDLDYQYFMELDDDYTTFNRRFDEKLEYNPLSLTDGQLPKENYLDFIIDQLIKLFQESKADTIALCQGGDFIGGDQASLAERPKIKRKAINTFLCSTDRPFQFRGSINEDVNSYTRLQQLGKLFFSVNAVSVTQKSTQSNEDGMTEIYLDKGTYIKSFYTILYNPSSTSLRMMGDKHPRIHHSIQWRNAVPKIISEEYKK